MRLLAIVIAILVIPVAPGAEASGSGGTDHAGATTDTNAVLAVDQVAADLEGHQGAIAIRGVVIKTFPERGLFVLVGEQEFAACGLKGCTTSLVPVQFEAAAFDGECPTPGQTVVVNGSLDPVEHGFRVTLDQVLRDDTVVMTRRNGDTAAR